jgi:tetratricopeptide (TPR) repeat protein
LGRFNFWMGFSSLRLGDADAAERHLRVAREQLLSEHPLDADAAFLLGRIHQDRGRNREAITFYDSVLQGNPTSLVAPRAQVARGLARISLGEENPGIGDFETVIRRARDRDLWPPRLRQESADALEKASGLLGAAGNYDSAIELMAHEQEVRQEPPPAFFGRLGRLYERRADQIENELKNSSPSERSKQEQKVREARGKAGDAYLAYSRAMTLKDDQGMGQALWKSIELYDRAGEVHRVISTLQLFIDQRPADSQAPEAMLRLGQAYQAAGMYDKAIETYRRNQFENPRSLAASRSGVPLARAFMAKGPEFYPKAEQVLLGVIENNPQITPEAAEFRQALIELASLFHRTGRYEPAVARLEEISQRYPADERRGELLFLMGDSYRKSARALEERISSASTQPTTDPAELKRARDERLRRASGLFDQAVEYYRQSGVTAEQDKLYLKLSYFYRADCAYDLGDYAEAIRLYGAAAFRYQDDVSSLTAYVQIVNANVALGKVDEAKAANERAKWMLRRMPGNAFENGSFLGSRTYWEQWLKWTGDSGLWK